LAQDPENITPKNGASLPWAGKDLAKFAEEYSFKPVKISGYLNYDREIQV